MASVSEAPIGDGSGDPPSASSLLGLCEGPGDATNNTPGADGETKPAEGIGDGARHYWATPEAGVDAMDASFRICSRCTPNGDIRKDHIDRPFCQRCFTDKHETAACPVFPDIEVCPKCGVLDHSAQECDNIFPCTECFSPDHSRASHPDETVFQIMGITDDTTTASILQDLEKSVTLGEAHWHAARYRCFDKVKNTHIRLYKHLEKTNSRFRLLAKEYEIDDCDKIIDCWTGEEKQYVFQVAWVHGHPRDLEYSACGYPVDDNENMQRFIAGVGTVVGRGLPKCSDCGMRGCKGPPHIEWENKEHRCTNCDSFEHKSRDCPEEKDSESSPACRFCNGLGHSQWECDEEPELLKEFLTFSCGDCRTNKHAFAQCPYKSQSEKAMNSNWICGHCGAPSHQTVDCLEG